VIICFGHGHDEISRWTHGTDNRVHFWCRSLYCTHVSEVNLALDRSIGAHIDHVITVASSISFFLAETVLRFS